MRRVWNFVGRASFLISLPLLWMYLRQTRRTRVIIVAEGQVLLVKGWLGDGRWMLPGGGLHRAEEARMGAIREVEEEVGIKVDPLKVHFLEKGSARGLSSLSPYAAYYTTLAAKPVLRPQKHEITATEWFRIDKTLDRRDVSRVTKRIVRSWQNRA